MVWFVLYIVFKRGTKMYTAQDALNDVQLLTRLPKLEEEIEEYEKTYARVQKYLLQQRYKENIPELCRERNVLKENSAFGAFLRKER